MKEITNSLINKFQKQYNQNKYNKIIENAIINNGINAVCLDNKRVKENKNIFNLELPKAKSYDQKNSGRCWCFAVINMIKYDVAKNMNIDVEKLDLSINYLTFFDKLEKSNSIYENVINTDNYDFKFLKEEGFINIGDGGQGLYARKLIKKYGLVLNENMPETKASENSGELIKILNEKIKGDVKKIIEMKKAVISIEDIRKEKNNMLNENFEILCKILGEPPVTIDVQYYDKDKKFIDLKNIKPVEFTKQFLKIDLENFVSIYNIPRYNREYYKKYIRKYEANIIGETRVEYVNVPISEMKKLVIKQLKNNIPVPFTCPTGKYWDRSNWILDTKIYNYEEVFPFKHLNKTDEFNFEDIDPNHLMNIVGVHLEENVPIRWKVENSWGNDKNKQYLVMSDDFFEECVIEVLVMKKYLDTKIKKVFELEPIVIDVKEW